MKNVTVIDSIEQMINKFNTKKNINSIDKTLEYDTLYGLPHYDTINIFLKKLKTVELENMFILTTNISITKGKSK